MNTDTEQNRPDAAPRIKGPIYVDYGTKLHIHPSVFINRGCTILDNPIYPVVIAEDTLIGPNVTISSVSHPRDWRIRRGQAGPSLFASTIIGRDCFIGANVTIL